MNRSRRNRINKSIDEIHRLEKQDRDKLARLQRQKTTVPLVVGIILAGLMTFLWFWIKS